MSRSLFPDPAPTTSIRIEREGADGPGGVTRPLKPRRPVRLKIFGLAPGTAHVSLFTSMGDAVWHTTAQVPRHVGNGFVGVEIEGPRDAPGGAWRLVVDAADGARAALRLPYEGKTPVRPVWRYRQRFSARGPEGLQSIRFSALVPRAIPLKLAVHPPPTAGDRHAPESTDDVFGNRWIHAHFLHEQLAAAGVFDAERQARPRARQLLSRDLNLVSFTCGGCAESLEADRRDAIASGEVAELPGHFQRFVQPEPHIESDAPEVLEMAERVPHTDDGGPIAVARAAWSVMRAHMTYKLQRDEYGALYAAKTGVGDCTEFAALFVALCRARGVPARVAAGCFGDEPVPAHAVAEIWLNGVWLGLDPTNQRTFCIGLPASFAPMMRANWMSSERAYQPYSATFHTRRGATPHVHFSESFRRATELLPTPGAVRIIGDAALAIPEVGGAWLPTARSKPTMTARLAADGIDVVLENATTARWRLQVVAAAEPDTPLVYAIREIVLASGHTRTMRLPSPTQLATLIGTRDVRLTLLAGDSLLDSVILSTG